MTEYADEDPPDPGPDPLHVLTPVIRDVMGPAVTVSKDRPLRDVARRMIECQVQGVIVVDDHSQIVGTLSERNLTLDARCLRLASTAPQPATAGQVMERSYATASDGELLESVVDRMLRRDCEQVVIVHGDSVVGVLNRHDLLRRFAGTAVAGHGAAMARTNTDQIRLAATRGGASPMLRLVGAWR